MNEQKLSSSQVSKLIIINNTLFVLSETVHRDEVQELYKKHTILAIVAPFLKSVDKSSFDEMRTVHYLYAPQMQVVREEAFSKWMSLSKVVCPKLEQVDRKGFDNCISMTRLDTENVKSLATLAFSDCDNLREFSSEHVSLVPVETFKFCQNLGNLHVPNAEIKLCAFPKDSVKKLVCLKKRTDEQFPGVIPYFQPTCDQELFDEVKANCKAPQFCQNLLAEKNVLCRRLNFNRAALCGVVLLSATEIGKKAFLQCHNLSFAIIPRCRTIGDQAFNYCYALQQIDCRNTLVIGDDAFNGCARAISYNCRKVLQIEPGAFSFNHSLLQIQFDELTELKRGTFGRCLSLRQVIAPKLQVVSDRAFIDATHKINLVCNLHIQDERCKSGKLELFQDDLCGELKERKQYFSASRRICALCRRLKKMNENQK